SILVDGGVFWDVMTGQTALNAKTVRNSSMTTAMMFAALAYMPFAMAFWYAAPLVMWQDMGVGKAIFYSFFTVRRSIKAFVVYGLAWLLIGVLLPAIFSSMVALLLGTTSAA